MRPRLPHACLPLLALAASWPVSAGTITVTTAADVVDVNWQTATIDDLPGPDGKVSLSEAFIAANHTPGHDTIAFAIPQNEWILQFVYPGRAVLTVGTGFFLHAFEEVTIDGTTQTAFTGDTNPNGWEVVLYGADLGLNAPGCTLLGFDSTAVSVSGEACAIEGNSGTMNISLFQAHGSLVAGNAGGTIKIDRSNDVVVVGNTVQRVRVLGFGSGQAATNNRIGGPEPADRNFITGYGTWNSEGLPAGAAIQLFDSVGTLIENNSIGTTPDGLAQGNLACTMGISFEGTNHDTVIRDNRIAGILGHGMGPHHAGQLFGWAIALGGAGSSPTLVGNTIGLDANGEATLGSVIGIDAGTSWASSVTGIRIGGLEPGEGNEIAGHLLRGVVVAPGVQQVRISGNSIHSNGALGIDLVPSGFGYGVSPNDPLDADTGGNGMQNFPTIDAALATGTSVVVSGTLATSPNGAFTIECFASPACDPSGHGEGAIFLGAVEVATDGAGQAAFELVANAALAEGWVITATATREPIGATSEFSACMPVEMSNEQPADLDGNGVIDGADLGALLAAWGPCLGCSADLDGDGVVDGADLGALLAAWSR